MNDVIQTFKMTLRPILKTFSAILAASALCLASQTAFSAERYNVERPVKAIDKALSDLLKEGWTISHYALASLILHDAKGKNPIFCEFLIKRSSVTINKKTRKILDADHNTVSTCFPLM